MATLTLTTVNLNAPDAIELGRFYQRLLGYEIVDEDPGWVLLRPPGGGVGVSVEQDKSYVRPTWPSRPDAQQQMLHLDIRVDDLEAAGAHAVEAGAVLAEYQPQDDVRVYLDPAGHPFCLWLG